MTHEILFAGFGGQGVLSMGMTLAYAGMLEGKEVSWMPSYGPEMRGGTANCIVIISDKNISSPIVSQFDAVIAMNQPSLDKFEKSVKPNGILMYDCSNVIIPHSRTDLTVVPVPLELEVMKLKNSKVKNMIMLGAFLSVCQVARVSSVMNALTHVLPERYHHLLDVNRKALEQGKRLVIEAATPLA
ncbi:MAG: 2-oxoacid:acceptor oxidoreductase family protein [Ignavibacteriae bacterium]|nr:2-oxoacid:acceptor oxidoreductase family protein [Ignavibacteriota bacterium]